MENISRAFEWVAVGVLVVAFALTLFLAGRDVVRKTPASAAYRRARTVFGRGVLVGLEILVAADLIRTVAVQPTIDNVKVLGLIVLVRVVLSFALDVEIDGVLPWRRAASSKAGDD